MRIEGLSSSPGGRIVKLYVVQLFYWSSTWVTKEVLLTEFNFLNDAFISSVQMSLIVNTIDRTKGDSVVVEPQALNRRWMVVTAESRLVNLFGQEDIN